MKTLLLLLTTIPTLHGEFLKIEMEFGGMECASCTEFVKSKFSRNPSVQTVNVNTKKSTVVLDLKPGNTMRISQVRDVVQQSGFTPKAARVIVIGKASVDRGYTNFTVAGSETVFRVRDPEAKLRELILKKVKVDGSWEVATIDGNKIEFLDVEDAEPAK